MQSSLLRLAVSLAAFALGVALTTVWAGFGARTLLTVNRPTAPTAPRAVIAPQAPVAAEAPSAPCDTASGSPEGRALSGDSLAAPISGGVLNGKAISKPAPAYPAVARAAGVSGTVVVMIVVDECGQVESARAASGHPLLQHASVAAAHQARFAPTRLAGRPVKVSGTVTYNYLLQ